MQIAGSVGPTQELLGSLGLRYRALLPGRGEDELGIGLSCGHAGAKYRQVAAIALAADETTFEITYLATVASWLAIQPTLQRIVNPGHGPGLGDAWILGARIEIAF